MTSCQCPHQLHAGLGCPSEVLEVLDPEVLEPHRRLPAASRAGDEGRGWACSSGHQDGTIDSGRAGVTALERAHNWPHLFCVCEPFVSVRKMPSRGETRERWDAHKQRVSGVGPQVGDEKTRTVGLVWVMISPFCRRFQSLG